MIRFHWAPRPCLGQCWPWFILPYGANGSQWFDVIHLIPCIIFQIIYMTYPLYGYPGSWFLSIWKKIQHRAITYHYSIAFVCYRPSITHPYFVSFVLHCMVCVCTRTSSFFVSLQMTLLIHVNSMTAFNASHFLNSETWHMISIIGHQRRLTSVILRSLTPENCHQNMINTLIHCLQECCYPLRHEWPDEHLFHLQ